MTTPTERLDFGVYQHSSGPAGGFVVRTRYDDWCPAPYNKVTPLKVEADQDTAQAYADALNRGEVPS